jgi:hypothetical protein
MARQFMDQKSTSFKTTIKNEDGSTHTISAHDVMDVASIAHYVKSKPSESVDEAKNNLDKAEAKLKELRKQERDQITAVRMANIELNQAKNIAEAEHVAKVEKMSVESLNKVLDAHDKRIEDTFESHGKTVYAIVYLEPQK